MDAQKELIAEFDRETAKTRKMLDAIPADADWNFKPHPKSMSLGRLAGHLTDFVGDWGNHTLTMDKLEFAADHKWEPYAPTSKAELLERFDKKLAETRPALVATTGEAVGPELEVCVRRAGVDRRHQVQRVSRDGSEPHDSPSRPVDGLSAADWREGARNLRAERGRDVRKIGHSWKSSPRKDQRSGKRSPRYASSVLRSALNVNLNSCPFPFRRCIRFLMRA